MKNILMNIFLPSYYSVPDLFPITGSLQVYIFYADQGK